MKISLLKLIEDSSQRDPKVDGSEAFKFLELLEQLGIYDANPNLQKGLFDQFNPGAAEKFVDELIASGWIDVKLTGRDSQGIFVSDKGKELLASRKV